METTTQTLDSDVLIVSQSEQQTLSEKEYSFLFGELERLQSSGVVSRSGVDAARKRYRVAANNTLRETAFNALMFLGALTLGAAWFFYCLSAWESLPALARGLAFPFVVFYAASYVFGRLGKQTASKFLLFCGAGTFWFSAFVLLRLSAKYDFYLTWIVAASAASLIAFRSKQASLHCLTVFFAAGTLATFDHWYTPHESVYVILFAIAALGFYWSARRADKAIATIYAAFYFVWSWNVSRYLTPTAVHSFFDIFTFALLISIALFLCDILRRRRFELKIAKILLLTAFYANFFKLVNQYTITDAVVRFQWDAATIRICAFLLAIAIVMFVWNLTSAHKRRIALGGGTSEPTLLENLFSHAALSFWIVPAILMIYCATGDRRSNWNDAAQILINAGIFVVACVSLVGGARRRNAYDFWSSASAFIVWMITFALEQRFDGSNYYVLAFLAAVAVLVFAGGWAYRRFLKNAPQTEPQQVEEPRVPADVLPPTIANALLAIVVAAQISFSIYFVCQPAH